MRCLLVGLLALGGCGSVDVTSNPPSASEHPCVTSFGCPVGERCDDGQCAADVGCPGPLAPSVLHESANDTSYPVITRMNGREYLLREPAYVPASDPDATFLDLVTGKTSVLHHAQAGAYCSGAPATCRVSTLAGTTTLLTGVTLDAATGVWSAASSQDLPAGYPSILGSLPDGDLILWGDGKPQLQAFTPSTGLWTPLLDLGGRLPGVVLDLASGPTLPAHHNSTQNGAEISIARFGSGAAWTSLIELPQPFKTYGLAIPTGDEWFVVADMLPSAAPHGWRVSPQSTQDLGTSDDPLLLAVAVRHSSGEARLDGTRGKAIVCKGGTCQSGQMDLATLKGTPIGSLTLPGVTRSGVIQQRWLACDAVDATIEEPIFPADPGAQATGYRLHAVRILAGATP